MSENNILSGGVDTLKEIRSTLSEYDGLVAKSAELAAKQKQLNKDIAAKQKAMATEIEKTVSKRKEALEKSFVGEVDKTRSRIKNVRDKRDKDKGKQINKRIGGETAELREEIRSRKQEIKGIFLKDRIPKRYNNSYFFSLYMPENIGDFFIILLSAAILFLIPAAAYTFLPAQYKNMWIAIALFVVIIGIGILWFALVFKHVRNKHKQALDEARDVRAQITRIRKRIKRLEKSIRKDKDESGYELSKYDDEIAGLEASVGEIVEEQKQALTDFEMNAKKDVTDEITIKYIDEIDKLKKQLEDAYAEQNSADERSKQLNIVISKKYEAYLGRDMMNIATLDSLIAIVEGGDARTISDAVALYKKQLAEEKNKGKN